MNLINKERILFVYLGVLGWMLFLSILGAVTSFPVTIIPLPW